MFNTHIFLISPLIWLLMGKFYGKMHEGMRNSGLCLFLYTLKKTGLILVSVGKDCS